jgi:hypothetical protein
MDFTQMYKIKHYRQKKIMHKGWFKKLANFGLIAFMPW